MLQQKYLLRFLSLLALIVFASACTASPTPSLLAPTQAAAEPQPTQVTEPTAEATAKPPAATAAPAPKGFVLFDKEKGEFQAYDTEGGLLFTSLAPNPDYPSGFTTSIVDGAIYYMVGRNLSEGREPKLLRSSPAGLEEVTSIPVDTLAALSVSPDERWAAWSTLGPENGVSELWITDLQTSEARMIASYSHEQSGAFFLRPFAWTEDGRLLFERALTGLGGYILFGGHNSLYVYSPAEGSIETIVPAEEMHGLCLDSYHPALETVVFNCRQQSQEITIRDLSDQSETTIPALPAQGVAGTAHYAPSGKWLAYAVAARNPDNESGQLVIVPADLSTPPQVIAEVKENSFLAVQGWLDEDTLIFNRNQWPQSTTWTVKRDGTSLKQLATGMWVGWLP